MRGRMSHCLLWTLAFFMMWSHVQAQLQCELTNDPSKVEVIYDDVFNFLRAIKMLKVDVDSVAILQREYIDKATIGFEEYIREADLSAELFVEAIRQRSDEYASLRDLPKQLTLQIDNIHKGYEGLKKIIPNAVFMPSYIFIGTHKGSNSQPSEYGLMTSVSELDEDIEKLYVILVHETIHVQQALTVGMEEYMSILGGPKTSLLALALREGTAYFFTLLSTGEHTHKDTYDYYIENERELWARFKTEMKEPSPGDWMWNKPEDPDQPYDVGYVVGARIVETYYNNAEDKGKAVQDILAITDYFGFLKKSGYSEEFSDQYQRKSVKQPNN